DQLPQAVVGVLDLVDDAAADGRVEAGEQGGPAGGVVGRLQAADLAVHAGAQQRGGVGRQPAEDVVGVGVDRAVAVGEGLGLAQGVDRVDLGRPGAGQAGVRVGGLDRRQQVVGVDAAAVGGADAVV